MNKFKERECDNCGEVTERKHLGKIRDKYYCKKCRQEIRKNFRKETIKVTGIEDELRELDNKIKREWCEDNKDYLSQYNKQYYQKKVGYKPKRCSKKFLEEDLPEIKGTQKKQRRVDFSKLSFSERQYLYRVFKDKGQTHEEAIESVNEFQRRLKQIKRSNKPEKEIQISKEKMLQELWNS